MNKGLIGGIAFVAGAAVGVLTTWRYFKAKYKKIADEEIESVVEVLKDDLKQERESHKQTLDMAQGMSKIIKKEQEQYNNVLEEVNYSGCYDNPKEEEGRKTMQPSSKPYYQIGFDEYGMIEDYKEVQVMYYKDDVLVDLADDEIIMDAEDRFGHECLKIFDAPGAPDAIYMRNDELQEDYEIVRNDEENYADIYNSAYEDY